MQYYSTRHQAPIATLSEAVMRSEPPDGGLYLPQHLPVLPQAIYNNMSNMSIHEIAYFVGNSLFGSDISSSHIKRIGEESINFPVPLVKINDQVSVLELFHGPSMTVKDIGSRYLARILAVLNPNANTKLNVLVATNGNSGSAVAQGLHGIENVNVFALYPKNAPREVASTFASLGGNVHAYCVNGDIDDCWGMIGSALGDKKLNERWPCTCANSLNIGRVLPQIVSFFYGYAQLRRHDPTADNIFVSVPTGNGGDLLAGYFASIMGLPISKLIAACNSNGAFHRYLHGLVPCSQANDHQSLLCAFRETKTRNCEDKMPTMRTLAYGIDTCCPANLPRFYDLSAGNPNKFTSLITSGICDNEEIESTIKSVYADSHYVLDPHSAVAYKCLVDNLSPGSHGIVFATCNPVRNAHAINNIIGHKIELPKAAQRFNNVVNAVSTLPPTYPALKKAMMSVLH